MCPEHESHHVSPSSAAHIWSSLSFLFSGLPANVWTVGRSCIIRSPSKQLLRYSYRAANWINRHPACRVDRIIPGRLREDQRTHLPDDHEQVDAGHSLQWRLGVQPAHIRPARGRELQHGSFDLPRGGVDVPAGNTQGRWQLQRSHDGPTQSIELSRRRISCPTEHFLWLRATTFHLNLNVQSYLGTASKTEGWDEGGGGEAALINSTSRAGPLQILLSVSAKKQYWIIGNQ